MKKNRKLIIGAVGLVVIAILALAILGQANASQEPLVGKWIYVNGISGVASDSKQARDFRIVKKDGGYVFQVENSLSGNIDELPIQINNIQTLAIGGRSFDVYSFQINYKTQRPYTVLYNDRADGIMTIKTSSGDTARYKKAGLFGW